MALSEGEKTSARIGSIDTARFLGITLVFFGHLVEQIMYLENASAAAQYKWVYSFHMPLFFLLAGAVFSDRKVQEGFGRFLKVRWNTRVVPYLFFTFLLGALAIVIPGWFPTIDLSSAAGFGEGTISTLMGMPAFNIPLWFLACLVALEIVHFFLARFWTTNTRLVVAAIGFYLLGYYLNLYVNFFEIGLIFWLVNLVPLGYAFYLTGILIKRTGIMAREFPRWQLAAVALLCVAGIFLTYDLNQGPFRLGLEAVVLLAGAPGHVLLFPLTALMGIVMVLSISKLAPNWRWLHYLGQITILIYCLHGLFYHFVNPPLAAWMVENLPASAGSVWFFTTLATIVSVGLTVPLAILIKTHLPRLAGSPPAKKPMAAESATA
ncbi:MAG: acyltransferase family protein [Oleiphilaceae bacterium]|nr:acyltransferase family protein [Oleiphilaceae bacterium]